MRVLELFVLLAVSAAAAGASIKSAKPRPLVERQEQPSKPSWALVDYSQSDCKGTVLAHWQGTTSSPACRKIDLSASIAGGSGNGARIHIWKDDNCTVPGTLATYSRGNDQHGYPCYNAIARSFSVDVKDNAGPYSLA